MGTRTPQSALLQPRVIAGPEHKRADASTRLAPHTGCLNTTHTTHRVEGENSDTGFRLSIEHMDDAVVLGEKKCLNIFCAGHSTCYSFQCLHGFVTSSTSTPLAYIGSTMAAICTTEITTATTASGYNMGTRTPQPTRVQPRVTAGPEHRRTDDSTRIAPHTGSKAKTATPQSGCDISACMMRRC